MPSSYPRGKEPLCPICKVGRIRGRGSKQCATCRFGRTPGIAAASSVAVVDEPSAHILATLKRGPCVLEDLARVARLTPGQTLDLLLSMQAGGANIHAFGSEWSLERAPKAADIDAQPYLSRPDGRYRFGWLSDTHLCSKYQRLDVLADLYRRFSISDVDRVFHAGNWIDGEARFNKFDLLVHGMDRQVRYLAEHYPQVDGLTTYTIAGDDHEGWYCQREGVDIGKYAEAAMRASGRSDWVNLGYMEAFVPLKHAKTGATAQLHIVHPGGGSSYATSYTVQKLVESYSGGSKPAVLLAGHYHKLEFINVRNVWCIQTGCTQDQTPFARKKRLHYALGGGICELEQDPDTGAIIGCTVQMFHYFDKGYHNHRWSMSGDVTLPERSVTP